MYDAVRVLRLEGDRLKGSDPLTVAEAIVASPGDTDGLALLEGVLRITGGELVDAPEVRS